MRALDDVLTELRGATQRLLVDVEELRDVDLAQPSLLPGWTRGHVVSHLAQNADGGVRLLTWARTGVPSFEYESVAARDSAIDEGACRSAAVQVEHLRASAAAMAAACDAMSREHWEHLVTWTTGEQTPAHLVARSRLSEVLIHHVDLDVGFSPAAWSAAFVAERLDNVVAALNRRHLAPEALRLDATDSGRAFRLGNDASGRRAVEGTEVQLLAWLLGRSRGGDLRTGDGRPPPVLPSTYST